MFANALCPRCTPKKKCKRVFCKWLRVFISEVLGEMFIKCLSKHSDQLASKFYGDSSICCSFMYANLGKPWSCVILSWTAEWVQKVRSESSVNWILWKKIEYFLIFTWLCIHKWIIRFIKSYIWSTLLYGCEARNIFKEVEIKVGAK